MKRVILAIILAFCASPVQAADQELLNVVLTTGRTYLIEVHLHTEGYLTGVDAATGEVVSFQATQIRQKSPTTESAAQTRLGYLRFIAWKIRSAVGVPMIGKVADVTVDHVYTTLGGNRLEVGEELSVHRVEGELKDPDTGKVIGVKRSAVAKIKVEEITGEVSKAKRLDETSIKVGDIVEQNPSKKLIAILPFLDTEGDETTQSKTVSEQLGTGLKNQGINLVERARYNEVVNELSLQRNIVFNQEQTQQIGRQLGATSVITGTLTKKGSRFEAHVKVIKVETGEIVVAVSYDAGPVPPNVVPVVNTVQAGEKEAVKLDPTRAKKKPLSYMFTNQKEIDRNWGIARDATQRKVVNNAFKTTEDLTSTFTVGGDCDIVIFYATAGKVTFQLFGEKIEADLGDGKKTPRPHRVEFHKRGNQLSITREDGKNQVLTLRDDQKDVSTPIIMKPWTAYSGIDKAIYPIRIDVKADRIGDPEVITFDKPTVPSQLNDAIQNARQKAIQNGPQKNL